MPRTNRPPLYRLHKARGSAVVTIDGKNHYLGPYGSAESHEKYGRLIAEWQMNGRRLPVPKGQAPQNTLVVNEVILQYLTFAATYYVKNGKRTGEFDNIRYALRP